MVPWLIIIIGLWIYPIVAFLLVKLSKNKEIIRRNIFSYSAVIFVLSILGLTFNFSTTSLIFDWICVSLLYMIFVMVLWWTIFQSNRLLKFIGMIALAGTLLIGYMSGTIGILGVGFIVGEYDAEINKRIDNNFIYKEFTLGNALSDHRGKRVEIYKSFSWLPFIEWETQNRNYTDYATYGQPLELIYNPENKILIMKAHKNQANQIHYWSDTIRIEE